MRASIRAAITTFKKEYRAPTSDFLQSQAARTDVKIEHVESICKDLAAISGFEKDAAFRLVEHKTSTGLTTAVSDYKLWYMDPGLYIASSVTGSIVFLAATAMDFTGGASFAFCYSSTFLVFFCAQDSWLKKEVIEAHGKMRAFNFVKKERMTGISADEITKTKTKD